MHDYVSCMKCLLHGVDVNVGVRDIADMPSDHFHLCVWKTGKLPGNVREFHSSK